jgi:hypothetical protein
VESWRFTPAESLISIMGYTLLAGAAAAAIVLRGWRFPVAAVSGVAHLAIGCLHGYRLLRPFRFEVFGYEWPLGASLREAAIVGSFGAVSLWFAGMTWGRSATGAS